MLSHRLLDQAMDAAERRASRQPAEEVKTELTHDELQSQTEMTPEVHNLGATALKGGLSGALMTLRGYFTDLQVTTGTRNRLPLNEIDKFKRGR